jgi:hypothetical protein
MEACVFLSLRGNDDDFIIPPLHVGFGLCAWLGYYLLVKVLDYFLLEDHTSTPPMWSLAVFLLLLFFFNTAFSEIITSC